MRFRDGFLLPPGCPAGVASRMARRAGSRRQPAEARGASTRDPTGKLTNPVPGSSINGEKSPSRQERSLSQHVRLHAFDVDLQEVEPRRVVKSSSRASGIRYRDRASSARRASAPSGQVVEPGPSIGFPTGRLPVSPVGGVACMAVVLRLAEPRREGAADRAEDAGGRAVGGLSAGAALPAD